jgi:hypothetical protein
MISIPRISARLCAPLLALFFITAAPVRADVILTRGGEEIVGRIVHEDFERVTVRTADGDLTFERREIVEIRRSPGDEISPMMVLPVDPSAALPAVGGLRGEPSSDAAQTDLAQDEPGSPEEEPKPLAVEPGQAGVISKLEGTAVVKFSELWEPAAVRMQLPVASEIRTGEGRSEMLLRGRGEVRLPKDSHLQLTAVDEAGLSVTLNLIRGSVWVDVEPPDTGGLNFNVQTPDLTAGVRGTVFNVEVEDDGSRVSVLAGVVNASAQLTDQTREVLAGFSVFCDKEGNLTAPEPIEIDLEQIWQDWEDWAVEASAIGVMAPAGADVIAGLTQLTAAEQQLHATMVAEHAQNTNLNCQADFLESLKIAFVRYAEDVRDLPPSEEPLGADGWRTLVENPGLAGWNGPYLPPNTPVPVLDGWENPITYRRRISRVGNAFGELISNGPNGHFSEGLTDDIRVLVRVPEDVQAEIQGRGRP